MLKYHALTKDEAWRNAPEEAERAREKEKVKGKNVAPGYRAKRGKMLASTGRRYRDVMSSSPGGLDGSSDVL